MHKQLLFILIFFLTFSGFSQGIDSDSTHHYIVMLSKSGYRLSYVIGEHKRVRLYNNNGSDAKGRLYFINDSTVQVVNTFSLKRDTFKIRDIKKIQTASLLHQVGGIGGVFVGGVWMIAGVALIGSAAGASSTYAPIAIFFGVIAVAASIPLLSLGSVMMKGRKMDLKHYDLKLHTAKGYQLKRKHLKYLYPRTPSTRQ